MKYPFSKYSGCGNDFILFDNRDLTFPIFKEIFQQLCHRQKGIGGDGVILLENSTKAHYKMRIFNSDGSEAEMCGNGIRCLLKFIQHCDILSNQLKIETMSKILTVSVEGDDIAVEMGNPCNIQWDIELSPWIVHYLDTGVPHAIIFTDNVDPIDVNEWGPKLRYHDRFAPYGVNVNFVSVDETKTVHVRTYERGVEQETLACGTGATASALAAARMYKLQSPIKVKVRSGDILVIDFKRHDENFSDVRLIGPAEPTFSGTIELMM